MRPIAVLRFGGLGANVPAGTYEQIVVSPDNAFIEIEFNADGNYSVINSITTVASGAWRTGSGLGSDYQIIWTNTSGAPSGGSATGVLLSLSSSRAWSVARASIGIQSCTATVEIYSAAGVLLSTGSITISASVES